MSSINSALTSAKAKLSNAEKKFPSSMAPKKPTPTAKVAPPTSKPDTDKTGAGIKAVSDNVREYEQATKDGQPPKMHEGGTVPYTGVFTLQKGETVVPKSRASEYRKVYVGRKNKTTLAKPQTRQDGGNTPAYGEKHGSGQKKVPYKQAQE